MNIIDSIKKIKNSKRIFFTTPTHSQGVVIPAVIKNLIGLKAFKADFSEIDALDNIRNPQNCIKQSQEKASQIYGSRNTFYLFNGSSSGIIALMMSVLKENDKVLIARNAHESIFSGLVLTGAKPIWFLPKWNCNFDIAEGVSVNEIKAECEKNPDIKGVIITSPTYEGIVSEIKEIAEFCRAKGLFFIVDEAHGALLPFCDKLPIDAIKAGADACVQSLHKTTPALTGSALLHIGVNSKIDSYTVQKNLNLINTTSPSWLIIASIEAAISYLDSLRGRKEIQTLLENISEFKENNSKFEFLDNENQDKTKILMKNNNIDGKNLSKFLDKNNVEDELITQKAVLLLCGIGTTKKKLKKLSHILEKFSKKVEMSQIQKQEIQNISLPEIKLKPKDAYQASYEIINTNVAIGRIIAENITPYPPCIPILVAGEVITKEHLKFLGKTVRVVKK